MQQIAAPDPLLVWDSADEWWRKMDLAPVRSLDMLRQLIIGRLQGNLESFRVAYTGPVSAKHFAVFCGLAWVWLRATGGVLVVEELADVTSPGKAPRGWGEIVRKHRHARGSRTFALTQAPAESDKTIVRNATVVHTGRMNRDEDRDYMARNIGVPVGEIAGLADLHYIERNMRTHAITRGRVSFR